PEDLEKITNQVNQLFTSSSQTELAQTVTDYKIDQVALKVDALSDDIFGIEKKTLRKLVNQAKQLSKARNVLVGGNFEKGHEWVLGRKATTVADHDLFKGDHLLLPPPTLYPSYAYQKIDESKLKSNTRYTVSGFVAQSEQLEVVVSRYGKEVHDMLDVPYEEALPISSDEHPNCCKPASCQCPSCNGDAPDSHFFSYSIDVGSLQADVNLGIEFGLRIAKSNGFAKISNLEIKEDRPLTDQEIKKVQRKEQKWKKAFDQEQTELAVTLQPTLNQINALYQQEDWNGSIHPHVTYQHLSDVVVPTLPKQTHWFMKDRVGEHSGLTQQFQQALDRAFQQIEEQNLIHNGNFANGLTDWTVTGDTQLTIFDEDPVLELAHWDASVSQTIEIMDFEEETEYKLRVRGKGKGTVTVQHGEEELETMTFNTTSFTTQEQTFYFEGNTVDVHVQSENNTFLVDSVELIEVVEEE
ncbi:toxin Cry1Ac domain D-VI-related protein, partial [Bacillus wiedmannii]|uniref:toxin Cry1Ac domain D-VI-related protein n=1 Tax=Bacillus wiedmannii TaxID=1890302 RepID=UPI000BED368D